jgi:DNA anti-recombination protein RmuC
MCVLAFIMEGKDGPIARIKRILPFGRKPEASTTLPALRADIAKLQEGAVQRTDFVNKAVRESQDFVSQLLERNEDVIQQAGESAMKTREEDLEDSKKFNQQMEELTGQMLETSGKVAEEGIEDARRNIDQLRGLPPLRGDSSLDKGK